MFRGVARERLGAGGRRLVERAEPPPPPDDLSHAREVFGGHRSAAERHVSTSGASRPAYVRAASGSSARVVSALRTYSTGTLCRGFFAWICFTRIVTACL